MRHVQQIYHNGVVATVDKEFRFTQAVAVTDGRIVKVGSEAEVLALRTSDTEVIDLHGNLMLPGLCDAHLHASDYIHNLDHLVCDRIDSLEELQKAIVQRLREQKTVFLIGNGLPQKLLDMGLDRHVLDRASPDIPVALIMWHGHGCVVNSAALKKSGIGAETPNPPGGFIRREESGEPSGVLEEASALQLIFRGMPSFSADEIADKLKKMQRLMNSMGYTAYTDSTVGPANDLRERGASGRACLDAYLKLLEEKEMTCRVSVGVYSGREGKQSYEMLREDLAKGRIPKSPNPDWLRFHMLKFFCDGVETSHTAWMKQDYADVPGNRGSSCFGRPGATDEEQVAELRRILQLAHDSGYQIGIHTVGNRAVHEAVEAILAAQRKNPRRDCRHYLIHGDVFGDEEDLRRCVENGILVSSQPYLIAQMYLRDISCVGRAMADRMQPLRKLLNMGLAIAGGSDSIAGEFYDWRKGIKAAVLRRTPEGSPFCPEQAITLKEAIRMYTINGAYQEFAEHERGSIEPGKFADFTVLDRNIFEIPPEEIDTVRVVRTVVGGRTVFLDE